MQKDYEKQILEKEKMRESEKMDLGKLKSQYARMRRLQNKAMLVFSTDKTEDISDMSAAPPSAINHLFVDVGKVRASRGKRSHKYPALKAPSKGVSALKIRDNQHKLPPQSGRGIGSTQERTKRVSTLESGLSVELRQLDDISESHEHFEPVTQNDTRLATPDVPRLTTPRGLTTPQGIKQKSGLKTKFSEELRATDQRTKAMLYQVDRTSVYPSNFKPFPKRNTPHRNPLLQGKSVA